MKVKGCLIKDVVYRLTLAKLKSSSSRAFRTVCWAFTLAEVLIALGIIGIVAVMTIPSLMQNINNKQLITATNNFNRRFGEALKIMNSQGVLAGRKTTENFVNELSKVFKVAKVCDNTKLDQCFSKTITWGEKEVDTTTLKKSFNIVDDNHDWGTDVMGVRFANGVSALLAYNPDCKQDSGNNRLIEVGSGEDGSIGFSTNNCLAMLYDVSSNKKPNKVGTDIQQTSNVENLGGILANINGVKITKIVNKGSFDPVIYGQNGELSCDEFKAKYGIKSCCTEDDGSSMCATYGDYWAAAVKICDSSDNLPTQEELINIAKYLYDDETIPLVHYGTSGLTQNTKKRAELASYGFPASGTFEVWSSSVGVLNAYKSNSNLMYAGMPYRANYNGMVICVKH